MEEIADVLDTADLKPPDFMPVEKWEPIRVQIYAGLTHQGTLW